MFSLLQVSGCTEEGGRLHPAIRWPDPRLFTLSLTQFAHLGSGAVCRPCRVDGRDRREVCRSKSTLVGAPTVIGPQGNKGRCDRGTPQAVLFWGLEPLYLKVSLAARTHPGHSLVCMREGGPRLDPRAVGVGSEAGFRGKWAVPVPCDLVPCEGLCGLDLPSVLLSGGHVGRNPESIGKVLRQGVGAPTVLQGTFGDQTLKKQLHLGLGPSRPGHRLCWALGQDIWARRFLRPDVCLRLCPSLSLWFCAAWSPALLVSAVPLTPRWLCSILAGPLRDVCGGDAKCSHTLGSPHLALLSRAGPCHQL